MKKMFTLALALIMAIGMTVSASAADIEISDSYKNETYTAYKIFNAVQSADESNITYTIATNSPWIAVLNAFTYDDDNDDQTAEVPVFTYKVIANDADNKTVQYPADFTDAAGLAAHLKENVPAGLTKDVDYWETTASDDGAAKFEDLGLGYYFVTTTTGSLCSIDTNNSTVAIEDKNSYPSLTKQIVDGDERVDSITADYGDTITFEIKVYVPETVDKDITVHDTLDTDMTFEALTPATGISVLDDCSNDECGGNVHFTVDWDAIEVDDEGYVTFQYTATLNGNVATATAHPNSAWLTYSGYITTADEVNVYTYQVDVFKYTLDDAGNKVGLAGAGFVLKNADGEYYVKDANGDVDWVADIEAATELMTSDAVEADTDAGVEAKDAVYTVVFDGLMNGEYFIVEKTVPDGYNPITADVPVTIANANLSGDTQIGVLNLTGTELPSTGGIGTTIFYTVGGVMMAAAVVLFVTKKKLAVQE